MSTSETGDELSRSLRELRSAAGLTRAGAAESAGIGQAALSRYETGKFVPTPARLDALLAAYGAPAEVGKRLRAIVDDLRAENRRVVVHRKNAPAFQRRIRDIEASSEHVATFQPAVIPGILQTEAYMRVLTGRADRGVADGVIAARLERQRLLGQPGHRWTQIMTAGALTWCAGSPETMVEQIDRHSTPKPSSTSSPTCAPDRSGVVWRVARAQRSRGALSTKARMSALRAAWSLA